MKIIAYEDDLLPVEAQTIRVAIYARYSCIGNSPYSADEQIQRARYHIEKGTVQPRKRGKVLLEIAENWVIKDEAKTGRVTRDGYELIKSGIKAKKFDVLVMDDISRMTRDMGDTLDLFEDLTFYGVEGYSLSDGISTEDANARDLFIFKGYANESQSRSTSKNTMRGLEVRALSGFSTGQKPYGYYSEPTKITLMKGVEKPSHFEIRVEQIQAEVIRRIWKLFSECMGCKAIAKKLNDESVLPPTKKSKRWREKMIWNILNQSKYIGLWKYRQTKVVKNPETERLTQQDRPKKEWIVAEREELRIIPRELEEKVIVRKKEIADERFQGTTPEQRRFSNTGRLPSHILIGTMSCGICGGNFFLASGKSGGYLGCMNASRQAGAECANKQMIKMSLVEWNIVDELKKNLEDSRTYDYLARRYNELMGKRSSDVPHRLNEVEITISKQEKVIANYTKFIGEGVWSDTIATELTATEHKVKELKKERDYLKERLGERLYVTPHAIRERLLNLNEVLGQRVSEANRIMRRLFPEKITMKPTVVKGKKSYEASGVLNLYAVTRFSSVVNGVPNEIRTRVLTVKG